MYTELNSDEMKTVVETYVIEETAELIYDNEKLDKWNSMIEELGLVGQRSTVKTDKSPIPFMHMKKGMVNMFECLCPMKVDIEDYSITPIPVEILELISLSKREGYFDKMQIWYDDKSPDPVCVGLNPSRAYSQNNTGKLIECFNSVAEAQSHMNENGWTEKKPYIIEWSHYLLGKWADVRASFEELKERAVKRYKSSKESEIKKSIRDYQRQLEDLEHDAEQKFS